MSTILLIISIVLILVGFIGCILPVLPGPPISYTGLLLIHFSEKWHFSPRLLIVLALVTIIVTILDYVVPVWGTKRFGGSQAGVKGATAGLIVGLFLAPFGIIIGPFIGAVIGELIVKNDMHVAIRSGIGSFIGFLMGTGMKLATSGVIAFYFFREII